MKYLIITALILLFGCKGADSKKDDNPSVASSEESRQTTAQEALDYKSAQYRKEIESKIAAQEKEIELIEKLNESGLNMLSILFDETKKNMQDYNNANPQEDFTKFLQKAESVKTMRDLGVFAEFAFHPNDDEEKDFVIEEVMQMMKLFYLNKKQYDSIVAGKDSVERAKLLVQGK